MISLIFSRKSLCNISEFCDKSFLLSLEKPLSDASKGSFSPSPNKNELELSFILVFKSSTGVFTNKFSDESLTKIISFSAEFIGQVVIIKSRIMHIKSI